MIPLTGVRRWALRAWNGALHGLQDHGLLGAAAPGPGDPLTGDAAGGAGPHALRGPYRAAYDLAVDVDRELARQAGDLDWTAPKSWRRASGRVLDAAWRAAELAAPSDAGWAARQEQRNRLEIYWLVRGVRRHLGLPPRGEPFDLPAAVERALAHDAVRALWLVEGLAHDWALAETHANARPLAESWSDGALPARLLPMLHAGLGLALAERHLAPLDARLGAARGGAETPDRDAVAAVLETFAADAHQHAADAHRPVVLEALGLVARCFFPATLPPLAGTIGHDDPLFEPFWHGLGRGAYFVPITFVPGFGGIGRALESLRATSRAAGPAADRPAEQGLGYAAALVNLAHPAVLERLVGDLDRLAGHTGDGAELARGMADALAARAAITPGSGLLRRLRAHRPSSQRAAAWHRWIAEPAARLGDASWT